MRLRGVAALAHDLDVDRIRRRHQRTWARGDDAGWNVGRNVDREGRRRRRGGIEHALLDHKTSAGITFLTCLKEKLHIAVQPFAMTMEEMDRTNQHGGV